MSQNAWIGVIVGIIVIGGGLWWFTSSQRSAVSDDGTPAAVDAAEDSQAAAPTASNPDTGPGVGVEVAVNTAPTATVTYNGSSFSPSTVTIKKGGTVTFTSTSGGMWVASALHPAHTGYDGTDRATHCAAGYTGAAPFDQCSAGTSYTFIFQKVGTWPYHNHVNASVFGKIVVVE